MRRNSTRAGAIMRNALPTPRNGWMAMVQMTSPEDVAAAFLDAWNRHDMDRFAALFTDDANFVNVVGMWWKSQEEIKAAHTATHLTIFKNSCLDGEVSSVKSLASGVTAMHVTWKLAGASTPDGGSAGTRRGILLLILIRERSGWRIKVAQNTDIVPGAIAPQGAEAAKTPRGLSD